MYAARAIRNGGRKWAIIREPSDVHELESAYLISILRDLGMQYEDARARVLNAGFPPPSPEHERVLTNWITWKF